MKRNSIKKASTFKLQAERSKFQNYLTQIDNCPVVRKFPDAYDKIRQSSQSLFDMIFNYRDDSPFLRGLNYDNRCFGFQLNDNLIVYRQFLGDIKEAYLVGDFNSFNQNKHQLIPDQDNGKGWYQLRWDTNIYRIQQNSRLQLRIIDKNNKQWKVPPFSCKVIKGQFGIYRDDRLKVHHTHKNRFSQLLSYTIDLEEMPLQKCINFIQSQQQLLQSFNTIIIKNLFTQNKCLAYKFCLSPQRADLFQQVTSKLMYLGIKIVIQWNFIPVDTKQQTSIDTLLFGKQIGAQQWQYDLQHQQILSFYLANISHYLKHYAVRGLHFTKVQNLCRAKKGLLTVKLINLLCDRLHDDAITLASSKQFIVGMTEPILEGGLGFSYVYNFHQSISIVQQHQSLYEVVKQVQANSNCLSLKLSEITSQDSIYLFFTILIAKKGIFCKGSLQKIKKQLVKILKIRRQDQLFYEEAQLTKVDENSITIKRGSTVILFNFSDKQVKIAEKYKIKAISFSMCQNKMVFQNDCIVLKAANCVILQISN